MQLPSLDKKARTVVLASVKQALRLCNLPLPETEPELGRYYGYPSYEVRWGTYRLLIRDGDYRIWHLTKHNHASPTGQVETGSRARLNALAQALGVRVAGTVLKARRCQGTLVLATWWPAVPENYPAEVQLASLTLDTRAQQVVGFQLGPCLAPVSPTKKQRLSQAAALLLARQFFQQPLRPPRDGSSPAASLAYVAQSTPMTESEARQRLQSLGKILPSAPPSVTPVVLRLAWIVRDDWQSISLDVETGKLLAIADNGPKS